MRRVKNRRRNKENDRSIMPDNMTESNSAADLNQESRMTADENHANNRDKKNKKKKRRKILILIVLIIIIIILLLTQCDGLHKYDETVIVPVESGTEFNSSQDDVKIMINTMPEVRKGVIQDLNFKNCNEGKYMICKLTFEGEAKTIGPIECGEEVKSCRMYERNLFGNRHPERGDYDGFAFISYIDEYGDCDSTIVNMMFHVTG